MNTIASVISHVNPRPSRTDAYVARIARHRESRRLARRRARLARVIMRELALMQRARLAGLDPLTPVGELRYDLRAASRYDLLADRAREFARASSPLARLEALVATSPFANLRYDTREGPRVGWVYDGDSIETYERVVSARGAR